MGATPVAHTFDLTHSHTLACPPTQNSSQTDTPLFLPFFLSTKKTSHNATNRSEARAVAKHTTTTKQHTQTHTYTYLGMGARGHTPARRVGVRCACCGVASVAGLCGLPVAGGSRVPGGGGVASVARRRVIESAGMRCRYGASINQGGLYPGGVTTRPHCPPRQLGRIARTNTPRRRITGLKSHRGGANFGNHCRTSPIWGGSNGCIVGRGGVCLGVRH